MWGDQFWKLDQQTNAQLLARLDTIVSSGRRLTAELVAHLGEVEERRLHLEAACASMFDYCVRRLGLSEDEACRRIEVARLARRFPALFPLLASGEVSLTVAAALKPYLTHENYARVLAAVGGKTVNQAREAIAVLFPKPDVPTTVRKLPERPALAPAISPPTATSLVLPATVPTANVPATPTEAPPLSLRAPSSPPASARIEPLSEARYRIQFTASDPLKAKLDQARDLMRHRNPDGDLAPIIERAMDLLLDQLMKERFGATKSRRQCKVTTDRVTTATRRTVIHRDGVQCTWVDEQGHRCPARGWLELDHREPRGKGGGSGAANVRVLCRNHNRFEAERAYGRETIERAIARRKTRASEVASK